MKTLYERAVAAAHEYNLPSEYIQSMVGMDVDDPLSAYYGHPEAQAAMIVAENQLVLSGLNRQLES